MDNFEGGIPTTYEHSGEQWDYPNAWPPLQYIVVMGLADTGHSHAMQLANEIATKWVRSNFEVWRQKTAMLEKVSCFFFYFSNMLYLDQTLWGQTWPRATRFIVTNVTNRLSLEEIKCLIFSIFRSGVEAKRGVEFRPKRNVFKIQRKEGNEVA